MKISFDLDTVIFDIEPLYMKAFEGSGQTYYRPQFWDIKKCYTPDICEKMFELFGDEMLYHLPLTNQQVPYVINQILSNRFFKVSFVTERVKKQKQKTFNQLREAGINCHFDQVYDEPLPKVEVLKKIGSKLHFDDSPNIVTGCVEAGIRPIMISNEQTPYNHYLRGDIEHYSDLITALKATNIYRQK